MCGEKDADEQVHGAGQMKKGKKRDNQIVASHKHIDNAITLAALYEFFF